MRLLLSSKKLTLHPNVDGTASALSIAWPLNFGAGTTAALTQQPPNRAVAAALEGAMVMGCSGLGRLKPALAFRQSLGVSGVL
jgi:hypothetical protein